MTLPLHSNAPKAGLATSIQRALLGLLVFLASTSCIAHELTHPQHITAVPSDASSETAQETWPSIPDFIDESEWIRLNSGEWLKGEFESLSREIVEFDSDELDGLKLDWSDIAEVITSRDFTVVRNDRAIAVGPVRVRNDRVYVQTTDGLVSFPRSQLMRMLSEVTGRANWSGRIRLSGTRRQGNTDQLDTSASLTATRRTVNSRTVLSFDHIFTEIDGESTADNQTFRGNQDVYLSPRFYLTPFGLELVRDTFQNIELRAAPYAGAGYAIIDSARTEWDVNAGLGYRYTKFDSVEPGEDDTRDTATLIAGMGYDVELTNYVDLEATYQINVSFDDTNDTNQDASLLLTFDFIWDLDFDVKFVWIRVGAPEADADGERPQKDDFRMDVGLSWEF